MKLRVFLLLICMVSSVFADDIANVYQIEIIFFENTDPNRFKAEDWPKFVGKLDANKAVHLNKLPQNVPDSLDTLVILNALDEVSYEPISEVIQNSVTIVDGNKRLLNNQEAILKKSKNKRFIAHVAWSQPVAWNVKSTPVYIVAGKNDTEVRSVISVKPVKGLYQLSFDTIYTAPENERDNKTDITEFRIKKDIKLKKKEVFYIDHPIIGALIIVSPVVEEY